MIFPSPLSVSFNLDCSLLHELTAFDHRERREHKVFLSLLNSIAGLQERIMSSEDEITIVAELVSSTFKDHYHLLNMLLRS